MKLFRRMLVPCAGMLAMSCTQVTVEKLPAEPETPVSNCLRPWGVSPASSRLFVGDSTRFSVVMVCGPYVPAAVRWFSGNTTIAVIDSVTGWVHGRATGFLTITAADVSDRNEKSAGALEVVARP
jgi:hypothetical protein